LLVANYSSRLNRIGRVLERLDGAWFLKKDHGSGKNFSAFSGMGVLRIRIQTLWCTEGHEIPRVEARNHAAEGGAAVATPGSISHRGLRRNVGAGEKKSVSAVTFLLTTPAEEGKLPPLCIAISAFRWMRFKVNPPHPHTPHPPSK
jgi:hypothetical protein